MSMAYALAPRANAGCGFHLATKGSFNGAIGEIDSGQARAGTDMPPSLFTWFGDAFVDRLSRGCWWTPPTSVLQCDFNQQPDHGFSIDCNGGLSFNGQSTFYQCPTGDGDEVNIYLGPNGGNCAEITIQADDCRPPCSGTASSQASPTARPLPSPSPSNNPSSAQPTPATGTAQPPSSPPGSATQTTTPAPTSTTTSPTTSTCTTVGPEEIILIDKANPDAAYGPNGPMDIQVSPNASSIFNFRFADADAGKTCELFFALPAPPPNNNNTSNPQPPQSSSYYYLTGSTGIVDFAALDGWADANTTYDTAPRVARPLDAVTLRESAAASGGGSGSGGGGGGEDTMRWGLGRFTCPGSASRTGIWMLEAPYADTCLDCRQGNGTEGLTGLWMEKC
ncbi:ubiquitin 3 binding protein But2 C-terminal domain-containing protein [Biscogniauxia mediterranea]|nr:ubiquitin 3 binding protein But2 C-terminal domain-containing protein [Biscogniauxia mediterranea]